MNEGILFKGKSQKSVTVVQIIAILFVVLVIASTFITIIGDQLYYSHQHTFGCAHDESDNIVFTEKDYNSKKSEYASVHDYMEGEYKKYKNTNDFAITRDCELIGNLVEMRNNATWDALETYVPIWVISVVALIAFLFLIKLAKQKYFVEAERIYGKKGYKKFDISFKEILEMKKYDKTVIIKTEKTTVALSLHKNYDEICGLIEPFVPVQDNATAGTSVVDDIKLF
ncbi:MAG: hypothetical protein IKT42_05275 [Clostridia bacterium]|nr:hypothetical protein [Clostridia bacterium]